MQANLKNGRTTSRTVEDTRPLIRSSSVLSTSSVVSYVQHIRQLVPQPLVLVDVNLAVLLAQRFRQWLVRLWNSRLLGVIFGSGRLNPFAVAPSTRTVTSRPLRHGMMAMELRYMISS